jgi:hypothetical protein
MSYRCPKCGEELIGAVNRCWKCGRAFAAPVTEAVAAQAEAAEASAEPTAAERVYVAQLAESSEPPPEAGPIRVGSPFAGPSAGAGPLPDNTVVMPPPQPIRPNYPQNAAAAGGAYAAIFLAVMSLFICLIAGDGLMLAVAALLIAFLGLIMGAWGLSSNQRKAAGIGLLLCVLAVSLSSVWTGLNAYREQHAGQLGERVQEDFNNP